MQSVIEELKEKTFYRNEMYEYIGHNAYNSTPYLFFDELDTFFLDLHTSHLNGNLFSFRNFKRFTSRALS